MDIQDSILEKEATRWAMTHDVSIDETLKSFQFLANFIYVYVDTQIDARSTAEDAVRLLGQICDVD